MRPDAKADTIVQLLCIDESGEMALVSANALGLQAHAEKEVNPMKPDESLGDSTCADQIPLAERELASFIGAVRDLFGPEQALLSAEDWLDGYELKDSPLRFTGRDWRAVTVAASARLANRVTVARNHRTPAAPIDPKGSTMLSFDCLAPALCEKREESNHAF